MIILAWAGFVAIVGAILAVDLGLINRNPHVARFREALAFAGLTVVLAGAFAAFIYAAYNAHWLGLGLQVDQVGHVANTGRVAALKFATGYLVELSLSMDNVFVIALIFQHLRVPSAYQHRVLFWGVFGALAMRGAMIGIGAGLVARYSWILYVFGAFLLVTAVRMLSSRTEQESPEEAAVVRFLRRHFRITERLHGDRFLVVVDAARYLTPLAVTLVLIETSDLIFAIDSIPAIFAVTADPFLVFTSNVFAILCLRSLYFGLAGLIARFRHLKVSLAVILAIVGAKMLAGTLLEPIFGESMNLWLLVIVALVLAGGAVASVAGEPKPADPTR